MCQLFIILCKHRQQTEESWSQGEFLTKEFKDPGFWGGQTTEEKARGRLQRCPAPLSETSLDFAAMQLCSHGDRLQLSKALRSCPEAASVHASIPYAGMQNTRGENEAISKQRNQQILSSAPSWPPLSLPNSKESYAGNNTMGSPAFRGSPHACEENMWRACPEKM